MPPGGEQLAKSKYGDYDIYKIGDRVLSFQPHPEFTEKLIEFHILTRVVNYGVISSEFSEQIKSHYLYKDSIPNQGPMILGLIKKFLKTRTSKKKHLTFTEIIAEPI